MNEIKLQGVHCSIVLRRPVAGVVTMIIEGTDVGELGERPFAELEQDLAGGRPIELFIDARATTGASIEVSGTWATWLNENRAKFGNVSMLTGSRFVRMTADLVRTFSGLGERMRVYTDPAPFDEALSSVTQAPRR